MKSRFIHGRLAGTDITAAMLALVLLCTVAEAQVLEEIVVTAQKREQSLSDVGISVTAFSGEQIRALGYTSSTDIAAQTPALNIIQFHPSITNVNIRGISQNDITDHLEPPVAMYMDEAYVSPLGAAHTQIFDLERVEVLRGPQGTLFGRNATGGLMHYVSRKPTDTFEGYAELTLAEYDKVKFEGAIGGPISDTLLGRLSIATNYHDGILENRIGEDLRADDTKNIRGQLLFQPTDALEILAKLHYSNTDTVGNGYAHTPAYSSAAADGSAVFLGEDELHEWTPLDGVSPPFTTCPGCDAFGYKEPDDDPLTGSFESPGFFDREIYGVTGNISWELANGMTITSITDYLAMNKDYREDSESSPLFQFNFETHQDLDQISQELRLAGETDSSRWVAGLYYLNIDTDQILFVEENLGMFFGIPLGIDVAFIPTANYTVTTESWAAFGQVEYEFSPEWTVIAGLRYTEDDKEMDFQLTDNFGDAFDFSEATYPGFAKNGWGNVSGKAELDWRPMEDVLLYASFNRGHKGGSWAAPIFLPPPGAARDAFAMGSFPHDEEVLHSWELGIKMSTADGRLRLNGSAFYYDYSDYQSFSFRNNVQAITNLDAEAWGGELEVVLYPWDGWDFLLGLATIDSEVKNVSLPSGRIVDRELPYTPALSLNGLGRYQWHVAALRGNLSLQADFTYKSDFCFSVVCGPTDKEDSYAVGNLRLGWDSDDEHWGAAVFVNNVNDAEYRQISLDVSVIGYLNDSYAAGRWIGGSVSYKWE